jgi:hypothetical protein
MLPEDELTFLVERLRGMAWTLAGENDCDCSINGSGLKPRDLH